MATEATIKQQIEKSVGGKYSEWKIGITNDPSQKRAKMGNPLSLLLWQADSPRTAQNVELYFLRKGMQSGGKAPQSSDYVYILLVQDSI